MTPKIRSEGGWIQTYTGRRFWPIDPCPSDVDISGIAHALALNNRFGGHTLFPYSVAQHCVLMARYAEKSGCDADVCLHVLMHDTAEAYLPDVTRPVKKSLAGLAEIEECVLAAIYHRYKIRYPVPQWVQDIVKEIDLRILVDERNSLMPGRAHKWCSTENVSPLGVSVRCTTWQDADSQFLEMFARLTHQLNLN